MMRLISVTVLMFFLSGGWPFQPASGADPHTERNRPVARPVKVEIPPAVDGDVLADPVWSEAETITDFWQTTPYEGEQVSEKTEVRVVYSTEKLYIGVVCYDTEPEKIVVSDSRRDASLEDTDSFRFILDTYRDGQNGFVFGTNPAGIEYDAQVTKEGEGASGSGRQRRGSGGAFNINWDGVWEVKTSVSQIGWSAEFAIPFRTLRFSNAESQEWGINFQRTIARKREKSFWARLPRQFNLNRVSMAGTLCCLEISRPRNLVISPYILMNSRGDFTDIGKGVESLGDVGLDVKYSLTPGLTLDLTYNTDFAQVEVDEQQVNLDRFSLFFPEKRPFFLENAGLFSVGEQTFYGPDIELFFSRRIGIGPDGVSVPIKGGARVTGSLGGMNIGLLNMQTHAVKRVTPANNFSVARIRRELPNRSAVGVLFTNRQEIGGPTSNGFNRSYALDGQVGIRRYGQIKGFAAGTTTPGLDEGIYAFNIDASHNSEAFLLRAAYTEVGNNFNPEMGFLKRQDYRRWLFMIFTRFRVKDFIGLLELRPHVTYWGYWKLDGFPETGYLHIDNHFEWKNGYEVHTGLNFTREGVSQPFEISDGITVPDSIYDHREIQLVARTDQTRWLSFSARAKIGGFFGGNRISLSTSINLRMGETFNSELRYQYNDVHLPWGDFAVNLLQVRLTYAFSTRLYLQSLIQYNDQDSGWTVNWRFSWLKAANTGLFIVFNQMSNIDGIPTGRDHAIILKYSRLFDAFR